MEGGPISAIPRIVIFEVVMMKMTTDIADAVAAFVQVGQRSKDPVRMRIKFCWDHLGYYPRYQNQFMLQMVCKG